MFINKLSPYLAWLGILLTSKPNQLQNRINNINTPRPVVLTTNTTRAPTTINLANLFICTGVAVGRYPHTTDCSKYFECRRDDQIVPPTSCGRDLHFSPTVRLCTLPREAGCTIETTITTRPGTGTNTTNSPTMAPTAPPGSSWLAQIESNRFHRAINEDQLVIYYNDREVTNARSITWPHEFIRNAWNSVLRMYGNFGTNRLYVLLRGSQADPEPLSSTGFLDSSRGFLNAIEAGSSDWSAESSANMDLLMRNIAQIIVGNARGIRYNGQEPNWADIFVYDMYQRTGQTVDRNRWATQIRQMEDSNIIGINPLFSQWYLHIYQTFGGAATLNRFFVERERNFPRSEATFTRQMNVGEFVHFWSGSVGANLTSLAGEVFGWSTATSMQYQQALLTFSSLNY